MQYMMVSYLCICIVHVYISMYNSCLMVFTVYGICTARGLYVLPRVEPEEIHNSTRAVLFPCTVKTMRQLTCTDMPYKANRQISFGARMSIL